MHTADAIAEDLHDKVRAMASGSMLKSALPVVARAAGLTESQVTRLAHRKWKNVPAHVYLAIQQAYRNHLERAEARMMHDIAILRARSAEHELEWQKYSAHGSPGSKSDAANFSSDGPSV